MLTLRIIGVLYAISGLWCALMPALAAPFLGYEVNELGLAEMVAVYGGLQLGIAAGMIATSLKADWVQAGLLFALCLSLGLALLRVIGMLAYDAGDQFSGLLMMAILEWAFVVALALAFQRSRRAQW